MFERRWDCSVDLNDEGWHILVADEEDERWLEIDRAIWRETSGYAESELLRTRCERASASRSSTDRSSGSR